MGGGTRRKREVNMVGEKKEEGYRRVQVLPWERQSTGKIDRSVVHISPYDIMK